MKNRMNLICKIMRLDIPNVKCMDRFNFISKDTFKNLLTSYEKMTDKELIKFIQKENLKYKILTVDKVSEKVINEILNNIDVEKTINVHLLKNYKKVEDYELYTITDSKYKSTVYMRVKTIEDKIDIYLVALGKQIDEFE